MLFNASALVKTRLGDSFKEPKPDVKPKLDEMGRPLPLLDEQMRELRYGDVVINALDSNLQGDEEKMKEDVAKWVKAVMKREEIAKIIVDAMERDGWAKLSEAQQTICMDRLSVLVSRHGLGLIGPVMYVLEHPPEDRKTNGLDKEEASTHAH